MENRKRNRERSKIALWKWRHVACDRISCLQPPFERKMFREFPTRSVLSATRLIRGVSDANEGDAMKLWCEFYRVEDAFRKRERTKRAHTCNVTWDDTQTKTHISSFHYTIKSTHLRLFAVILVPTYAQPFAIQHSISNAFASRTGMARWRQPLPPSSPHPHVCACCLSDCIWP